MEVKTPDDLFRTDLDPEKEEGPRSAVESIVENAVVRAVYNPVEDPGELESQIRGFIRDEGRIPRSADTKGNPGLRGSFSHDHGEYKFTHKDVIAVLEDWDLPETESYDEAVLSDLFLKNEGFRPGERELFRYVYSKAPDYESTFKKKQLNLDGATSTVIRDVAERLGSSKETWELDGWDGLYDLETVRKDMDSYLEDAGIDYSQGWVKDLNEYFDQD